MKRKVAIRTPLHTAFYARWLGPASSREEPLATCANCSMVAMGYRAELKCCTHFPFLPNFSIGAILTIGAHGQKQALAAAFSKGHSTPLGLFAPPEFESLKTQLGAAGFGREPRLACPFLAGDCTIWEYRPGVCASYFCQSAAADLWKGMETKVNLFEWTLAHEALWRLGFTADETRRMEEARQASQPEGAWFEFIHAKDELYRKAYAKALEVSPQEIAHLMGGR